MNIPIGLIVLAILILAVFMPRYGILTHYRNYRLARERALTEDTLKHLLDQEHLGGFASSASLAGVSGLSQPKMMRLIQKLEAQGLIESRGLELHLTSEGERWALHVVRAHRLWERYLADEARMPLEWIHDEANRREHNLSDSQLDELDAALGHPTHDPHGDPIPTRQGMLPEVEGMPVTAWQSGAPARIVHLEDEPAVVYEQILAAGLRLGQTVRVLEKTPQRLILSDGENEYRLAPSVAANIQVQSLPVNQSTRGGEVALNALGVNQPGEIVALDDSIQGFTRRRFLDLGLTPGTIVYPELRNFFGDPRAYRVRGTLIALRKDQAAQIWVKPVES